MRIKVSQWLELENFRNLARFKERQGVMQVRGTGLLTWLMKRVWTWYVIRETTDRETTTRPRLYTRETFDTFTFVLSFPCTWHEIPSLNHFQNQRLHVYAFEHYTFTGVIQGTSLLIHTGAFPSSYLRQWDAREFVSLAKALCFTSCTAFVKSEKKNGSDLRKGRKKKEKEKGKGTEWEIYGLLCLESRAIRNREIKLMIEINTFVQISFSSCNWNFIIWLWSKLLSNYPRSS